LTLAVLIAWLTWRLLGCHSALAELLKKLHFDPADAQGYRDSRRAKPNRGQLCETRYRKRVLWNGRRWIRKRADHADKVIPDGDVGKWRYV
jgi:hypothetical protein